MLPSRLDKENTFTTLKISILSCSLEMWEWCQSATSLWAQETQCFEEHNFSKWEEALQGTGRPALLLPPPKKNHITPVNHKTGLKGKPLLMTLRCPGSKKRHLHSKGSVELSEPIFLRTLIFRIYLLTCPCQWVSVPGFGSLRWELN